MVLKRWSYLLVAAWLINALICFQPYNFHESNGSKTPEKFYDNTLVDIFFHHVVNHTDHQHRPISHRNRFVHIHPVDLNVHLQSFKQDDRSGIVRLIAYEPNTAWLKTRYISAVHAFLFRLSPF